MEESLGLRSEACGNELLSQNLFAEVPDLIRSPFSVQQQYHDLRLVGIRFDPVAEETRLVFQPLLWAEWGVGGKGFWAEDAAIHLFFKTSKEKILGWQHSMRESFGNVNQQLLGVHPYFKPGNRAQYLNSVVCALAKEGAFKLTFMNVRGSRVLWIFGGFHLVRDESGALRRGEDVTIPNAAGKFIDQDDGKMSVQRVARLAGFLRAGVLPKPWSRGAC